MYNTADYMEEPEMTAEERVRMYQEVIREFYGWDDEEDDEEDE